jgi:RNA-directed DNA polymerase
VLFDPSTLPIKRHTQIKADANPFDPEWDMYFERRLSLKMVNSLSGRNQLIRLWKEQNGNCPICNQKITTETGWHNHHIKPRILGGSDKDENRVLLHPNCHASVHSQGLSVEKPRPSQGV